MSLPEPSEARKEVQRAVGRNLLNFQRVELLLKHLLGGSAVRDNASDLMAAHEQRKTRVSEQTLGMLIRQLFEEFLFSRSAPPPDSLQPDQRRELRDREIAFAATITLCDEHHAEWKARLEKIVNERNWLVHHFVEHFLPDQLNSDEGCQKALARLEEQRELVFRELEALKMLIAHLHELHTTMQERLKDPKFRHELYERSKIR